MKNLAKKIVCSSLVLAHLSVFAAPPPLVALSSTPLYSVGNNIHPNLLLDLSVEFPTVKYAYSGIVYDKTVEYVGYFNSKKCYTYPGGTATYQDYNNAPRTVPTPEKAAAGTEYFSVSGDADTSHECSAAFSGNFMNWASSSAIDMLRLALTGGDRIETLDTATQTVLQRAFLKADFYRGGYFPQLSITAGGNISAPNKVTPFNANTLYITNCDNKIQFSDVSNKLTCGAARFSSGTLAKTDKLLGEFYARIKVCDAKENTTRTDLCMQYPSGSYKPVGQMQRNQNTVRYGAFGYLMDNVNTRYGGVLRAPLKYVGSKQYKATNSFVEETNDRPEWNPNTGVFISNPENDASGNSGVINYLNKFGRTGSYKGYDPVSELYYESIRYLQGRQPTPGATAGMTDAMKDNFQVQTNWVDPIEHYCQRNYIVSIADSNTHQDKYVPGNIRTGTGDTTRAADQASAQWPAFDVMAQTKKVALLESGNGSGNSAPVPALSTMDTADTGSSGGTFYMAGTAYWANTNDIRLDKHVRVKTFSIDVDENGNGSIDNLGRTKTPPRLSQLYLAAKYGGFNDYNQDGNPFKTFDSDGKTVVTNNKEWASGNGSDPDNYFLASNPKKMMAAIAKIFDSVVSSGGTLAGVGISSTSASDNPWVYEPGFKADRWSGSLQKKSALNNSDAVWDAGVLLSGDPVKKIAPNPAPNDRKIYTAAVQLDGSLNTLSFNVTNLASLGASDQLALNSNPHTDPALKDDLAIDRINYLRGDRSKEIVKDVDGNDVGIFRPRDGVLGDIVNSAPVYYGAPAKNVSGSGYSKFYTDNLNRQKAVYVGANDGMLHAFDAGTGAELFAYVPNALISKLNRLTDPQYQHQSYVDGKITVKDTQIEGVWKTLLVSGMGSGNKGVFALDVTNPADFSGGKGAIWEFTEKNDSDIGYLLAPPLIAKFRTGTKDGKPTYGNFVVVSSGYNNYDDATKNGDGALFLLSLDKKAGDPWLRGSNYFKFIAPIADAAKKNGLSAPNVAYGGDGAVKYGYAGDLQGNMWRFVFTGDSLSTAKVASKPLFIAKTAAGVPQPITVKPQIIYAPGGGYVVFFGTGKYLEPDDAKTTNYEQNSYYAILDTTYDADAVTGRSQLALRTAKESDAGFTLTGNQFTFGTTAGTKKGWYFDFYNSGGENGTGERSVTDGTIAGSRLFFNSLMLNNVDPCSSGSGRIYQVDTLTGLSDGVTGGLSTIGFLTSPVIININTTTGDRNALGNRRITTKISVRIAGTGGKGTGTGSVVQTSGNLTAPDAVNRAGRISWRELQNWQELRKDANK
ncbi:MAG: pilus assembly protein PilY [Burkholderiales bacterium]|nr:pilus assembly protein PilY [Burkholderiales bacterium]